MRHSCFVKEAQHLYISQLSRQASEGWSQHPCTVTLKLLSIWMDSRTGPA